VGAWVSGGAGDSLNAVGSALAGPGYGTAVVSATESRCQAGRTVTRCSYSANGTFAASRTEVNSTLFRGSGLGHRKRARDTIAAIAVASDPSAMINLVAEFHHRRPVVPALRFACLLRVERFLRPIGAAGSSPVWLAGCSSSGDGMRILGAYETYPLNCPGLPKTCSTCPEVQFANHGGLVVLPEFAGWLDGLLG
jgi:hypothetical protein